MKSVSYYASGSECNRVYYSSNLNFDDIDDLCRPKLFDFEIEYIKNFLGTSEFYILYFYRVDDNHKVVQVVDIKKFQVKKYDECFITIKMPYLQYYYSYSPSTVNELVYVFKRKDGTTYESTCNPERPKENRSNHFRPIEIGYINGYGHKLINIYYRSSLRDSDGFRSITGAGLVLDK